MMMLMAILYFFSIFEFAILAEIGIGNRRQMSTGNSEDFKENPELANIFELYDLLAVRGQKLFAHPAIVDDPEEALKSTGIIDESSSFNQRMFNFARDFREFAIQGKNAEGTERELKSEERKRFIKFKYPITDPLRFQPLLLDAINKVNTQKEIQNDLKEIWAKENADELRIRQKYLFKFGFIMDCIYAYYMDDKQKIDFDKIKTDTITKIRKLEQHPFYPILIENRCASTDEIRIFVNLIIPRMAENNNGIRSFFNSYMKEKFVKKMIALANEQKKNGKLEEEYAQLREDPFFPEKLPKIFNFLALLELIPQIMSEIIRQIKPYYDKKEKTQTNLMWKILMRIKINVLKGEKMFISSHYQRAASQIPNEKLRKNMETINEDDTIFTNIFKNDIKYQYEKWYSHLKFHMLKFLAEKYVDLTNLADEDNSETIKDKIAKNILQKTLNHVEEGNIRMEVEKKNKLHAQLNLRIFCVGIRQMDSMKRILLKSYHYRKSIFRVNMDSKLLKIVPEAMEKFNEIIIPKEKLLKEDENEQQENKLFFEAVSEVRREICEEKQWQNEKQKQLKKTILSFINSESHFGDH